MINRLVDSKRVLVCAGPGGVGKTTTAAAVGVVAARAGRRVLVATIDPAPRLADALEMPDLSAEPRALPAAVAEALGIEGPGVLFAARLDTPRTFKRLVEQQVVDPAMRARIFENPIYRQITSTLTGSQEYAATLALHELAQDGGYDLVVLDTPPTAHALDFLEAPHRIAEAITSPAVQWFARPRESASLLSWQRLRTGPAVALRHLGRLVGSQFLDDLGAFLLDFREALGGFLARAREVEALLRKPEAGFLLVLAPEVPAVNEALYFAARLRTAGIPLEGFIANRVLQAPGASEVADLRTRLGRAPALAGQASDWLDDAAQELTRVAGYLRRLADAQHREIARLEHDAPGIPLCTIPLLTQDVSSLSSLRAISHHLDGQR